MYISQTCSRFVLLILPSVSRSLDGLDRSMCVEYPSTYICIHEKGISAGYMSHKVHFRRFKKKGVRSHRDENRETDHLNDIGEISVSRMYAGWRVTVNHSEPENLALRFP